MSLSLKCITKRMKKKSMNCEMASSGSLTFHKRSTLTVFKFKSTWRASDPKKRPSFNGHPGPSPGSIPTQHFKRIPAFRQKFRQCQKVARIQRNDQFRGGKFLNNGICINSIGQLCSLSSRQSIVLGLVTMQCCLDDEA